MSFIGRTLLRNVASYGKLPLISNNHTRLGQMKQQWLLSRGIHQASALLSSARVQCPAPDFKGLAVVNGEFKEIQLTDYYGKYLVLFFYPLDFTFVCPTEIVAFSDSIEEFKKLGAEVVAVSVDSHFSHLAWTNAERKQGGLGKVNFALLSDLTKKISTDYGVLLENEGIALRGTFLIDPNGVLRQYSINDLPVGRSVEEVLRLIKAFQFVDKHGEVCPANWNPKTNPDTIKPDVEGSKEYFKKH